MTAAGRRRVLDGVHQPEELRSKDGHAENGKEKGPARHKIASFGMVFVVNLFYIHYKPNGGFCQDLLEKMFYKKRFEISSICLK